VRQNKSEFHCFDGLLNSYLDRCLDIIKSLDTFTIHHIRREENSRANYLSQQASGYFVTRGRFLVLEAPTLDVAASKTDLLAIESVYGTTVCSSVQEGIMQANENSVQVPQMIELENNLQSEDWRVPLINYLKDLSQTRDRKIRRQALKYTLLNDELYRRTIDGLFLKCLDFIGQIHPASSKRHRFIPVATDYFTKWTEAVPLRNMTHKEVISFVLEHIIHRFGIPQTLTTDQGSSFMFHQFREFAESFRIKLLNSSPYYAQANGQAESSNKTLIKLIKKKIEEHPKKWHEVLSEALWAHRISKHGATQVTPFELVYGQEAVLPVEINLQAFRVARQNDLSAVDYTSLMMDIIDDVSEERLRALREIEKEKLRVAKAYNKKAKENRFR
jgi:hypothetical protein